MHAAGLLAERAAGGARGCRPAQRAGQADGRAAAHAGEDPAGGILLLTSRVSVELIQKAAGAGIGTLAAVSVPTALAIRVAEAAGITLIAVARSDGFEVFTHPARLIGEAG